MANYFYTEPGCAACKDARKFLISHGLPFEERDIRANPEYLRILTEELDSLTTPTLVLGDNVVVGFDRNEYKRALGSLGTKHAKVAIRGGLTS
jgi:glutaredoxin